MPQTNIGEDDDLDEDAFEALFRQLEEDLKNDDPSALDGDEDISEEDLALLERELEEALGDEELQKAFSSSVDESEMETRKENINNDEEEDDYDDEEEKQVVLKNWQIRRLAYALKNGRRKTSVRTLHDFIFISLVFSCWCFFVLNKSDWFVFFTLLGG